jgi:AcrR family transcriptional regulator
MSEMSTRERILDTAERLFAEKGLDATSLRDITSEAKANLASVNYYFRSKDDLILAVYSRRIEPINRERMRLLDDLSDQSNVEAVLEAFLLPLVEGLPRKQLISRMYVERADLLSVLFDTHFRKPFDVFLAALSERLPEVPRSVLAMRLHFLMGAFVHTITRPQLLEKMRGSPAHTETLIVQFIAFGAAGLRARVPAREKAHA